MRGCTAASYCQLLYRLVVPQVVDVYCLVLEAGGAEVGAAITAASMALADAGLALRDNVAACSVVSDGALARRSDQVVRFCALKEFRSLKKRNSLQSCRVAHPLHAKLARLAIQPDSSALLNGGSLHWSATAWHGHMGAARRSTCQCNCVAW